MKINENKGEKGCVLLKNHYNRFCGKGFTFTKKRAKSPEAFQHG